MDLSLQENLAQSLSLACADSCLKDSSPEFDVFASSMESFYSI
eukprot:CAMPEP_0202974424 /NCGR_PEP_ID=MMETSP1396-20130829/60401_1 /ASSEMBLY_ACC=CAM_ASM_000872 /TAXON_ID= /ORGANISM="Pseudokeronopsis sp., Strain Brazil" /LENGTH=42 /DNA_ID= /DNA_START= /DNA_END= /DNA_ORIENTATION=